MLLGLLLLVFAAVLVAIVVAVVGRWITSRGSGVSGKNRTIIDADYRVIDQRSAHRQNVSARHTIMPSAAMIIDTVAAHSGLAYSAVFVLALAETVPILGAIIPGSALIIGIAALVPIGALKLWPLLIVATLGAIVGDGFSYCLGHRYHGATLTRWPLNRYPAAVEKSEAFLRRHGVPDRWSRGASRPRLGEDHSADPVSDEPRCGQSTAKPMTDPMREYLEQRERELDARIRILEAENERLRAALEKLTYPEFGEYPSDEMVLQALVRIARAALKGTP
jgi:hypothetical protein